MSVFLLTGCASGMGRHLTGQLLDRGHLVCATDIELRSLGRVADEERWDRERILLRHLDVGSATRWEEVLDETLEHFGALDVVMNIAGVLHAGWVLDLDPAQVEQQLDANLKGVILGTTMAARRMVERGGGHIVNMGSMSSLMPISGLSVYSASKYGVRAFSLAAAYELRRRGVYVTAVCPDPVRTPMLERMASKRASAMAFSARRPLTVQDVERAIFERVLPGRPLEVGLPWGRSWAARLVNLFSWLGMWLTPLQIRAGLKRLGAAQ